MNEQEFAELSAAAALHALSPEDERRFRAALTVNPQWRAIAGTDAETAAALASTVEPVAPPPSIRSALLAAIADDARLQAAAPAQAAGTAQTAGPEITANRIGDEGSDTAQPSTAGADAVGRSDEDQAPAPRRSRLRLVYALAACLALFLAIGTGAVAVNSSLNRAPAVVALEQIESADDAQQVTVSLADGGSATAHWSASLGRAVLVTDGIPTPAEGQTYELWFVRGDAPVSAGTFSVEAGDATAELHGQMHEGDAIAVTVEQAGGSPSGAPTSDPIIVIPTA